MSDGSAELNEPPAILIPLTPEAIENMARAEYDIVKPTGQGWDNEPDAIREHYRSRVRRMIGAAVSAQRS